MGSKAVTPSTLRKELQRVTNPSYTGSGGLSGLTNNNTTSDEEKDENKGTNSIIVNKKFNKIKENSIICTDGTKALILNPLPCIKWKCRATPDETGVRQLVKTLDAVLIKGENNNYYCISIRGSTTQLELVIDYGDTELRLNNKYLYIDSKHIIIKGKERYKKNE